MFNESEKVEENMLVEEEKGACRLVYRESPGEVDEGNVKGKKLAYLWLAMSVFEKDNFDMQINAAGTIYGLSLNKKAGYLECWGFPATTVLTASSVILPPLTLMDIGKL